MSFDPILLIGGAGIVGRQTAELLRSAHPGVPLLIAGRNLEKASEAAASLGHAEGVKIDFADDDLGLAGRPISAMAIFFTDVTTAALRFAQRRGVPYLSISPALHEVGPDIAAYMQRPTAAPVVLGTEWLVGATTIPTLEFAKSFKRVDALRLGAVLGERDETGPAGFDDLERQTQTVPAIQARRHGRWIWRQGDDLQAELQTLDGTTLPAMALSPHDVVALATETGAPNAEFNLAIRTAANHAHGESMSTEILIDLAGIDHADQPLATRHAVTHADGQMPLTGLGVALVLERLTGLDGRPATSPGLYFPYQLLDAKHYLERFKQIGGQLVTRDTE
ncbi:NAD(P)-dependent oxidoreductase [Salinicola avicenniae]|uniref:NAD(P)-dependent oxidoreductase n=1 Tax=Salinicola avicenniae TaxID=2916836 RepID=UPI002073E022|nr:MULTISPECIES: NAD(P)-dependent oxidoreductase [unclassified Salinicola]